MISAWHSRAQGLFPTNTKTFVKGHKLLRHVKGWSISIKWVGIILLPERKTLNFKETLDERICTYLEGCPKVSDTLDTSVLSVQS